MNPTAGIPLLQSLAQGIEPWSQAPHAYGVVLLIGITVGFLSGLLGKGGSAIATPCLQIFAGVPAFFALASPLPSTIPTTLSASVAYHRKKLLQRRVIGWSLAVGIPATIFGSLASRWVGGQALMVMTALFVCGLGLSFVVPMALSRHKLRRDKAEAASTGRIIGIALLVGLLSGLLANGGGILFAPLFIRVLRMPVKQALACSLVVAGGLAIPGTIAHWWLGHIDWWLVLFLSLGSIPSSYLGARVAVALTNEMLEKVFGIMLCLFGAYDLYFVLWP